jgi:hypothetical protein
MVVDADGEEVCSVYQDENLTGTAARIVREHNAHAKLVGLMERLTRVMGLVNRGILADIQTALADERKAAGK